MPADLKILKFPKKRKTRCLDHPAEVHALVERIKSAVYKSKGSVTYNAAVGALEYAKHEITDESYDDD